MAADVQRVGELVEQPPGHVLGVLGRVYAAEHHDELVTSQAGHDVLRANRVAQLRRHGLDEQVADGVAKNVVDGLQPVHVDEQDGNGSLGVFLEKYGDVLHERAPIWQPGQFVVVCAMAEAFLSDDTSIDLSEQGSDRLERVHLRPSPQTVTEMHETQDAARGLVGDQRHHRHGHCGNTRTGVYTRLVVRRVLSGTGDVRLSEVLNLTEDRIIGVPGHDPERVWVRHVGAMRPFIHEHARAKLGIVVAEVAGVDVEEASEVLQDPGDGRRMLGRRYAHQLGRDVRDE